MEVLKALKIFKTPKMLRLLIIIGLIATIVFASIAVYYKFFYSPYLTAAETAGRIESIYNRASVILGLVADDMRAYIAGNISQATFTTRITSRRTDMMSLRTEVTELRVTANRAFLPCIDLLDRGLQSYVTALDYASEFNLDSTRQYLEEGTNYINQSRDALPTF